MSFDFLDRRSAERFAELLDETSGGRRHHTRGQADEDLAELVAIGHSLSAARSGVQVDPEFRVGLRAMLVATAERDGIGATATRTEAEPGGGHAAAREPRRGIFGAGRRIRARGAIVIGVAAGAMAVSGISAASENAAPGDALYGVKRQTERAQLAMAGSDVTRGQLSLDFARTRLTEAATLGDTGNLTGVLDDMDADTRQGVKLLTGAAVARRDDAPLAALDGFVAGQRQTLTPMLDRVGPEERQRAVKSLVLLEDVHNRTRELRAGLACTPVTDDGVDSLGPKLQDCMTGKDATTEPDEQTGQGQKAKTKPGSATTGGKDAATEPEDAQPTAGPKRTGGAATPAEDDPAAGPDAVTDEPSPVISVPPVEPPVDEKKGGLGGLLDGIFG